VKQLSRKPETPLRSGSFHDNAIDSSCLKPWIQTHVSYAIHIDCAIFFYARLSVVLERVCAIPTPSLRVNIHLYVKKTKSVEAENQELLEKYGEKAQKIIRECVDSNIPDYEYLKSFAIRI
jgi:hypothetical protein